MAEEELNIYENETFYFKDKIKKNLIYYVQISTISLMLIVNSPVYKIWGMWWDGEDKMTNIGKICFEVIKKKIQKSNGYSNNCSDILQVFLIWTQDELWLDSTIFTPKDILKTF